MFAEVNRSNTMARSVMGRYTAERRDGASRKASPRRICATEPRSTRIWPLITRRGGWKQLPKADRLLLRGVEPYYVRLDGGPWNLKLAHEWVTFWCLCYAWYRLRTLLIATAVFRLIRPGFSSLRTPFFCGIS